MRKTTKQYHKVAKETYVGGNYTIKTGGNYTIWAESIEYNAGGQIIMSGKEGVVMILKNITMIHIKQKSKKLI